MAAHHDLRLAYQHSLMPLVDRREFLRLTAMAAAGLMIGGCGCLESLIDKIKNRPVRLEINSLDPSDPNIEAYKTAVSAMRALPSSDRRNWTAQAQIHQDHCTHGNWLFLPWHRAYLYYFEEICRELSGMEEFALPYWNWSLDGRVPPVFWGSSSNPLVHARGIGSTDSAASSMVGPGTIQGILDETNFLSFGSGAISASSDQRTRATYGSLEGTPHNYIHGFIGGDMSTFMSPLDPIFWLHHNMVECIWVKWNLEMGNPNTNDPAWMERHFTDFVDRSGAPVDVSVVEGLLYPILKYRFEDSAKGTVSSVASAKASAGRARMMPQNQRSLDETKAFLREGAKVNLETLKRYTLVRPSAVPVRQPTTLAVPIESRVLRGAVTDGDGRRVVLNLDGVTLNHTEDFYVRVFANDRAASIQSSLESPAFVGSFAFFGHSHEGDTGKNLGKYRLDLTSSLRRLGDFGDSLDVTLVAVPFEGRELKTREFSLQSAEVAIVKDTVEMRTR